MNHELSYEEIESLALFVDEDESPIETVGEYIQRFQSTYPNFPDKVISQWFYDHRQCIHQNSWLPYGLLKFSLVELTNIEISLPCFSNNPFVDLYRTYCNDVNENQRIYKLSEFIRMNSTWPVAPIVLENMHSDIELPSGVKCDSPYHLLEGHHRFGVLQAYQSKIKLKPTHKVWIAQISS